VASMEHGGTLKKNPMKHGQNSQSETLWNKIELNLQNTDANPEFNILQIVKLLTRLFLDWQLYASMPQNIM
jgi:hypothetical protein